jgi:glycosyltransferase involved in cell wall biosynthesis
MSRHARFAMNLKSPPPSSRWWDRLMHTRLFRRSSPWGEERAGAIGRILRRLPEGASVLYHDVYPEPDDTLPIRRFLLQEVAAGQAHEHAAYGHTDPSRREADMERQRTQNLAADGTISFGNFVGEAFEADYGIPRSRVTAIGCGPILRPSGLPQTDLARYRRRRLLFVGRDWERKGGPLLLEAFSLLRDVFPDATLTVVGVRDREIDAPGVRQIPFATGRDLERLFLEASAFCMPSECETWGLVYSEAAHLATPIVGFREWALPDIVLDGITGLIAEERSAAGLAASLIEAFEDPEQLQSMGQAALVYARESLDWPVVLDRLQAAMLPETWSGDTPLPLGAVPAALETAPVLPSRRAA